MIDKKGESADNSNEPREDAKPCCIKGCGNFVGVDDEACGDCADELLRLIAEREHWTEDGLVIVPQDEIDGYTPSNWCPACGHLIPEDFSGRPIATFDDDGCCVMCGAQMVSVEVLAAIRTEPGSLQSRVAAWARETFPGTTDHARLTHLAREVAELTAAPGDASEMADCYLILLHHAAAHGVILDEAAEAKFAEVQTREWGEADADGVVEHVREPAPVEVEGLEDVGYIHRRIGRRTVLVGTAQETSEVAMGGTPRERVTTMAQASCLIREANAAREKAEAIARDILDDFRCLDSCDSNGHGEQCPATNGHAAFLALRAERDALLEGIRPFANVVLGSSGRIPTERLSLADWHRLVSSYTAARAALEATEAVK